MSTYEERKNKLKGIHAEFKKELDHAGITPEDLKEYFVDQMKYAEVSGLFEKPCEEKMCELAENLVNKIFTADTYEERKRKTEERYSLFKKQMLRAGITQEDVAEFYKKQMKESTPGDVFETSEERIAELADALAFRIFSAKTEENCVHEDTCLSMAQKEQIILGAEHGVDMRPYNHRFFTENQLEQIRLGLEHGIEPAYVTPRFGHKRMEEIRLGQEAGVNILRHDPYTCNPDTLRKIRMEMTGEDAEI